MEKKHEKPFCSMFPIMHGIDSYSARSKYYLTIKNLVCAHLYGPLISEVGCKTKKIGIRVILPYDFLYLQCAQLNLFL